MVISSSLAGSLKAMHRLSKTLRKSVGTAIAEARAWAGGFGMAYIASVVAVTWICRRLGMVAPAQAKPGDSCAIRCIAGWKEKPYKVGRQGLVAVARRLRVSVTAPYRTS